MNLLLDTHIWVWALTEPERLAPRVRAAFSSAGTRLWLSPVSVWEAMILIERGRVRVEGHAGEWIEEALQRQPIEEATLTRAVAIDSRRLATTHRDPVDRFLAATARVFGLTLVTADRELSRMKGLDVLVNREVKQR
jgi:PIN domain nuclease of toxin-antitoxin system